MPEEWPGEETPVRLAGSGARGCGLGAEGHGYGVVSEVVCDGGERGTGGGVPGTPASGWDGI